MCGFNMYIIILHGGIEGKNAQTLQSQTKIVGTLPPNAVLASGPSPRPPNVVYRG